MTTIVEAERGVTAILAQALGRSVDGDIFRGPLPSGKIAAVAVEIDAYGFPGSFGFSGCFSGRVAARFLKRDEALAFAEKIGAVLPYHSPKWTIRASEAIATARENVLGQLAFHLRIPIQIVARG